MKQLVSCQIEGHVIQKRSSPKKKALDPLRYIPERASFCALFTVVARFEDVASEHRVNRTHKQFSALHSMLVKKFPKSKFPKDVPSMRSNRYDNLYIEEKSNELNQYLHHLLAMPEVKASKILKEFLEDSNLSEESEDEDPLPTKTQQACAKTGSLIVEREVKFRGRNWYRKWKFGKPVKMVFFVCEGCNETLKKNKVDAHAARCRNCWAVSCVDCSVVFEGNDYAAHTSCISEAQKYEGSLYKAKAKKMTPQERWMQAIQDAKASNDAKLQNVLDRVAGYDNVPRKKAKFVNFMKNSIGGADTAMIEKVWNVLEDAFKKSEQADAAANNATQTDAKTESADAESSASSKKRASSDTPEAEEDAPKKKSKSESKDATSVDKPIKWAKLIKSALKSAPSKQLDLEELRAQVLQKALESKQSTKSEMELKKELKEALRSGDKFSIVEVVRLTE
ncbi:hypothetical protein ATCC90586_008060 [Pythium insidiosum]|nr:hypothetical protein ATCC90586_008060 [Pythium insidiosum]